MKCEMTAVGRFTWPGRAESFICAGHEPKLVGLAQAMGLPLEVIHLTPEEMAEKVCQQGVGEARPLTNP